MALALVGLAAVIVLTLGTALFVAAEFSLVAADRAELENAQRHGDRAAGRALQAVRTLSFQLSGAQLGITITTLVVGFLAEPSISDLLHPALTGLGLPDAASETIGVVVALVAATVLQMVVGELIPKNWAIAHPTPVSRRIAGPMRTFTGLLRPLIAACNGMANLVVRRLGIEPQEELRSARSATELGSLVRTSAEEGTLPGATAQLLARSLAFGERVAGEVMTPRNRVVELDENATVTDLLTTTRESGHSRFPVVRVVDGLRDIDDIAGVVHVKKAIQVPPERRDTTSVRELVAPIPQVPEQLRLGPLLARLRQPGLQMAVVVDEYGGTAGIVTLEDVVEELVGDVRDEHDTAEASDEVRRAADVVELSARLRIDEAAERVPGFTAPEGPYDTLAGLLLARLGRLARPGDTVEVDGWTLTATDVEDKRIDTVTVRLADAGGTAADAGPTGAEVAS
ncbi:Hemolysin, contains CBS domains [Jatrophihabitans endophyticus]|uniref:Hemolysin, contains CBS domains n=1 Tax=Jatrophihabitans endophyticus TaxID=1206085 RepID=A0A1M5T703_9ACTN|nr:hemolysin family protein [Jatrophihabitans endophyticus]SHH46163.1 Hemolysin, contains CBS domains [Jatrophihabitans endophyticus]